MLQKWCLDLLSLINLDLPYSDKLPFIFEVATYLISPLRLQPSFVRNRLVSLGLTCIPRGLLNWPLQKAQISEFFFTLPYCHNSRHCVLTAKKLVTARCGGSGWSGTGRVNPCAGAAGHLLRHQGSQNAPLNARNTWGGLNMSPWTMSTEKLVFSFSNWQAICTYLESCISKGVARWFSLVFPSCVRSKTELQNNILWKIPVNLLREHTAKAYENFGIHCSTVHSDPFHYFLEHMDLAVNFNRVDNFV